MEDALALELSVWDEDFNADDFIGRLHLENKLGEFEKSFTDKVFGDVKCNFDIKKSKYEPWK